MFDMRRWCQNLEELKEVNELGNSKSVFFKRDIDGFWRE